MTRVSMLEPLRRVELLPGETGLNLKHDSYYGMVDVGPGGSVDPKPETPKRWAARLARDVREGRHVLDGDEQNYVEVLTGKRLQQKIVKREDLPPTENLPAPAVTSLDPSTAALGSPDFTLSVKGTGFDEDSVIVFAGHDEPTTLVSDTELTTGVDMSVWLGVDPAIPVSVRNFDDQMSNEMMFSFTEAAAGGTSRGETSGRRSMPPTTPSGRLDLGKDHKSEKEHKDW